MKVKKKSGNGVKKGNKNDENKNTNVQVGSDDNNNNNLNENNDCKKEEDDDESNEEEDEVEFDTFVLKKLFGLLNILEKLYILYRNPSK